MFWRWDGLTRQERKDRREKEKQERMREEKVTDVMEKRRCLAARYSQILGDPLDTNSSSTLASNGLARGFGAATHSRPQWEESRKELPRRGGEDRPAGQAVPAPAVSSALPKLARPF